MRKADFTVVSMLLGVLAASILGAAMLAAPAAGSTSSRTCTWSGRGSCSLAFTSDGQPAGTVGGAVITAGFDSHGGPVKVEVLDGSGRLVTGSTAAVTVAIGSNPGSGSLAGTATVYARGGIASFSNLSIDKPGIGYTLTASSPGITPAASDDFTIWGSLQRCSTTPCSASLSSATTAGTVTTFSAAPAELLGAGIGGVSYSCAGSYKPVSDPFNFNTLNTSGVAQPGARFAARSRSASPPSSPRVIPAPRAGRSATPPRHRSRALWHLRNCGYRRCQLSHRLAAQLLHHPGGALCAGAPQGQGGDVVVTFLASGDPIIGLRA